MSLICGVKWPIPSELGKTLDAPDERPVRVVGYQCSTGEATNDDHAENTTGLMTEKVRQPIKRFIGRRTAAERVEKNENPNGAIEGNGALQGQRIQYDWKLLLIKRQLRLENQQEY